MRSTPWPIAALAVWLSCGDSNPPPPPATPSPYGLDARPANPTCLARQRPTVDTGVALQRQWAGLTFSAPVYMTQAPGDNDTWYVVERGGTVRAVPANATSNNQTKLLAVIKTFDDLSATGFALDEVLVILGQSPQPGNTRAGQPGGSDQFIFEKNVGHREREIFPHEIVRRVADEDAGKDLPAQPPVVGIDLHRRDARRLGRGLEEGEHRRSKRKAPQRFK